MKVETETREDSKTVYTSARLSNYHNYCSQYSKGVKVSDNSQEYLVFSKQLYILKKYTC